MDNVVCNVVVMAAIPKPIGVRSRMEPTTFDILRASLCVIYKVLDIEWFQNLECNGVYGMKPSTVDLIRTLL